MKKTVITKAEKNLNKAAARIAKAPWDTIGLREAIENTRSLYFDWIDENESRNGNDEAAMFLENITDWLDGYTEDTPEATQQAIKEAHGLLWHYTNN